MNPLRFEDEFPAEAAFMIRVFETGGTFKRRRFDFAGPVPPPRDVPRNAKCPCGSGRKTKRCHRGWTSSIAGESTSL